MVLSKVPKLTGWCGRIFGFLLGCRPWLVCFEVSFIVSLYKFLFNHLWSSTMNDMVCRRACKNLAGLLAGGGSSSLFCHGHDPKDRP